MLQEIYEGIVYIGRELDLLERAYKALPSNDEEDRNHTTDKLILQYELKLLRRSLSVLEDHFGTANIEFVDEDGNPV